MRPSLIALGSTQTGPSGHNRVQYPCLAGCVTGTETQGIGRIPPVVPREGMTRLSRENGPSTQEVTKDGAKVKLEEWHGDLATTITTTQSTSMAQKILEEYAGDTTTTITINKQSEMAVTPAEVKSWRSLGDHATPQGEATIRSDEKRSMAMLVILQIQAVHREMQRTRR